MKPNPTSPGWTCAGTVPWLLPLATSWAFSRAVAVRSTCEIAAPVLLRYSHYWYGKRVVGELGGAGRQGVGSEGW